MTVPVIPLGDDDGCWPAFPSHYIHNGYLSLFL